VGTATKKVTFALKREGSSGQLRIMNCDQTDNKAIVPLAPEVCKPEYKEENRRTNVHTYVVMPLP
jgi:hypothetical protein